MKKKIQEETKIRRSWQDEVYGFLFGVLAAFFLSCSAACVKAMKHAVPDFEARHTHTHQHTHTHTRHEVTISAFLWTQIYEPGLDR